MPTIYPTRQTLQQVALSHARCRTLSRPTRDTFQMLADGQNVGSDEIDAAMWEALASCATRAGQSMTRRAMVDALNRLKRAVYDGEGVIPVDRSYCVGLPVVVTVHTDGRVTYMVDTSEMAQAILESTETDDEIREADAIVDSETVERYLAEHGERV